MTSQSCPIPVLVTRPAAQGDRFLSDLQDRFADRIQPVVSPLLSPVFLTPDLPAGPFSCLILTSETGAIAAGRLRAAGRVLPLRAVCVGDRTAQVARDLGFDALSARGDADSLVAQVLAGADTGPFLHLRGREARGDIAPRLTARGRSADSAIVYAQDPVPLTDEARRLLQGSQGVIVPLFSPRTADLFAVQGPFRAPLHIAALSPAVAARASSLQPGRLVVADRPDAPAMIAAIASLLADPHA